MMATIDLFPRAAQRGEARPLSKSQRLFIAVARSRMRLVATARALKDAYDGIRQTVYQSKDYTPQEFYEAMGEPASSQIKQFAVLAKAALNAAAPGVVVDDVPRMKLAPDAADAPPAPAGGE